MNIIFIDTANMYDKNKVYIWSVMKNKVVPHKYINIDQDMYEEVQTNVRAWGEGTENSFINTDLDNITLEKLQFVRAYDNT